MIESTIKVNRDAYFFIDVVWKSGFKHRVPARGYELKSWLNLLEKNNWIDHSVYSEVLEEQFNEHCHGKKPADKKQVTEKKLTTKKVTNSVTTKRKATTKSTQKSKPAAKKVAPKTKARKT